MNIRKITTSALVLLICIFAPFLAVAENARDAVVAKVGNLEIKAFDVGRELQKTIPMQLSFHGGMAKEKMDKLREEALQTLIDRSYKVQYAISEEIAVDPQVLTKEWDAFSTKYSVALNKMPAADVSAYRADIYRTLLAKKAEKLSVDAKVKVADEEVQAYYESNKHRFFKPKSFTASHIYIKIDPTESKEDREARSEKVVGLLERAQSGEDFYNLAYYESEDRSKFVGGSLGTFHANQVVPEFAEAIEKMSPGDIEGPVKTEFGYHIIKLDAVEDARQLSFDEVANKIRGTLEEEQREGFYSEWMSSLRSRFPFQRFDN